MKTNFIKIEKENAEKNQCNFYIRENHDAQCYCVECYEMNQEVDLFYENGDTI